MIFVLRDEPQCFLTTICTFAPYNELFSTSIHFYLSKAVDYLVSVKWLCYLFQVKLYSYAIMYSFKEHNIACILVP